MPSTAQAIRHEHGREQPRQRPSILRTLQVRHEDAARCIKFTLVPTLTAIYRAETVIPKLAGSLRAAVEQTREQIIEALEGATSEITGELARFKEVIEQNGLADVPALHYNRDPYRFEIEVSSPLGNRYVQLIEKLDEAIGNVELLWLMEIFDWYQHIDGPKRMSKAVFSAANRVQQIQQTVENGLRRARASHDAERQAKAADRAELKAAQHAREAIEHPEVIVSETGADAQAEAEGEDEAPKRRTRRKATAPEPPVETHETERITIEDVEAASAMRDAEIEQGEQETGEDAQAA